MLFTRTIRRTMMFGVALILLMLITLSLSGISGLMKYQDLVEELRFSMAHIPRQSDLDNALQLLCEPLSMRIPTGKPFSAAARQRFAAEQQRRFLMSFQVAKQQVEEFHTKLRDLPDTQQTATIRGLYESRLSRIYAGLDGLNAQQAGLGTVETRHETAREMAIDLARLLGKGSGLRDFHDGLSFHYGLSQSLRKADRVRHSRFWLICWTTALVVVLFLGLVRYAYVGIFAPLRKLHQGACRVAQGDFDYRVELVAQDEMAELAESFNKMTTRFQEIARDLDQQVCERSQQLVRSERLAGIGFLAAGVAHEINNPLSAIVLASDSLLERRAEPPEMAAADDEDVTSQYLEMIQREAFRCRQITTRLLDFSRGQDESRCRNDLTLIVQEVLSMVQHMEKYRDRVIEFSRIDSCFLDINGPEIKQVVLNLVANALESMESGGCLRIDLVEMTDAVQLTLIDNGCGMTPEVIENLFEPFFTRRRDGKGTGLGMSISHRIVGDHGGTLVASSDGPGYGSTIRVHLPRNIADDRLAA